MANKAYNSPLFLTGMEITDGEIPIRASQEGRLGTGQIYDEFTAWFGNDDVKENLNSYGRSFNINDERTWPVGFKLDDKSTWELLVE